MTKIVLTVESKVVGGTDRGGEDLFIVGNATLPGDILAKPGSNPKQIVKEANIEVEFYDPDEIGEDGVARFGSGMYEFEWKGTKEDAIKLLGIRNPKNWKVVGDLDGNFEIKFNKEMFIDGNAD